MVYQEVSTDVKVVDLTLTSHVGRARTPDRLWGWTYRHRLLSDSQKPRGTRRSHAARNVEALPPLVVPGHVFLLLRIPDADRIPRRSRSRYAKPKARPFTFPQGTLIPRPVNHSSPPGKGRRE